MPSTSDRELPYPERLELARVPTPLERLSRLSEQLGVELWVKRDDLTGVALTGNKVRKLEFLLADARRKGCDVVLTCGGAQSNHCRATAIAARRLGMDARIYLRVPDPASPPDETGNIFLDRLVGAEIEWITPAQYRERGSVMAQGARALEAAGRRPYVIPEGGSNALGAWGYVRCMEELERDLEGLAPAPTAVVYACGSGGTGAGLILGNKLLGTGLQIVGVNVCDDRTYFVKTIGDICDDAIRTYGLPIAIDRERDIDIRDGYVGRGYALSRPEELELLASVARAEALFLDPAYTAKAFYGLTQELANLPSRLIFLHTGGLPSLLSGSFVSFISPLTSRNR